jgi:hypothetical protein
VKYLVLAMVLVGCGEPANPPVVDNYPRLKAGKYAVYFEIADTYGNCAWLKPLAERGLFVEFDEGGRAISPLGNDLVCETIYPRYGRIEINCSGAFKVRATGVVAARIQDWSWGQAVLEGNVGGCRKIEVDWNLIAKESVP